MVSVVSLIPIGGNLILLLQFYNPTPLNVKFVHNIRNVRFVLFEKNSNECYIMMLSFNIHKRNSNNKTTTKKEEKERKNKDIRYVYLCRLFLRKTYQNNHFLTDWKTLDSKLLCHKKNILKYILIVFVKGWIK